jgi:hypothetical protein
MNILTHIIEPRRLLLTWQPADLNAPSRTRRVVGEIFIDSDGQAIFRYLYDTPDYVEAVNAGFQGFPAFGDKQGEIRQGVIETLMRRLPPRNREDFSDYLAQHRLPFPFNYSNLALLGYTGARLPSDGFALVPDFPLNAAPCDLLIEVAGLRHVYLDGLKNIHIGDAVTFEIEDNNPVDAGAVAVIHQGNRIGYINRVLKDTFSTWLQSRQVEATVDRLNGKPERPLVYVWVSVT